MKKISKKNRMNSSVLIFLGLILIAIFLLIGYYFVTL